MGECAIEIHPIANHSTLPDLPSSEIGDHTGYLDLGGTRPMTGELVTDGNISSSGAAIDFSSKNITGTGTIQAATSVWWRIQHVDLASTPALGAVGATYTPQSVNNLSGYQLDNNPSEEYLYFNAHIGTDWDEASDLEVVVQFETNIDNSGGADADTVNFDLVMYYKGDTETAQKTQDLDASVIVGKAAQYYHGSVTFTIDYDLENHVVQIGDCVSFALHLNDTDSEVANVICHHAMFRYKTNKPRAEV